MSFQPNGKFVADDLIRLIQLRIATNHAISRAAWIGLKTIRKINQRINIGRRVKERANNSSKDAEYPKRFVCKIM
jgi:hypothetical protein